MTTPTTPPADVEAEGLLEEEREPWWQRLVTGQSTAIALILVGLIAVFSFLRPEEFLDVNNARNIATDAAVLLVLAVGLTFVIITAGIDLSVGAVLVFSGVVAAKLMNEMGGDNWGVILVGLGVALASGLGWGLLNGFLVAKAKIPAFIVTLGTLGMALGSALLITGGVDQRDVPFKLIDTVGSGRAFDEIPYLVLIAAVVALVFGVILAMTRFGRYTYAIGSNEEAVRRAGVNVDAHLIKVYAIGGHAFRARRLHVARALRHHDDRRPLDRQPRRDLGGRHRRHEPLRRHWHDDRHGRRRLHPGRSPQRFRHRRRPAVLAAGGGGRRPDRGGLPRPAAPGSLPALIHWPNKQEEI